MSRVYFVHPVKAEINDISGALEHGEPIYINKDYVFPDLIENEELPNSYHGNLVQAATDFDPDSDLFAIVGDHLQLVAFAGMLGERHGRFRVLRWDRDAKGYLRVQLEAW